MIRPEDPPPSLTQEKPPAGESCESCGYCIKVGIHKEGAVPILQCRRQPPTVQVGPNGRGGLTRLINFPDVTTDCWCGEWKPLRVLMN